MLDVDFIRAYPEIVKQAVKAKGEKADVDALLELDKKRRGLIQELDTLRHRRNEGSATIAQWKSAGKEVAVLMQEMSNLAQEIKDKNKILVKLEHELDSALMWIPNIPTSDVPVGTDAAANELIRSWGERPSFDFKPKPHWDLGKDLEILDFERASKITGSGFVIFKGWGARLERALINFMLDLHTKRHHYQEIAPPYLVNRASVQTTGQLPKLNDDMYHVKEDDIFLIPTAEVPLTNLFRDEIIADKHLPKYFVSATPCFRYEAGSYGKDTRGLTRIHQFDKVELLKFVHPEKSFDELEALVNDAEMILQTLGLAYRVVKLCTGEMTFASAKTYDLEAWAPGLERYLEVSSCSCFTDFQARRGNIRFRDQDGKLKFIHTLNGSGVALPRTLICLLETYQQKDGSVKVPEVLRPYLDGITVLNPVNP